MTYDARLRCAAPLTDLPVSIRRGVVALYLGAREPQLRSSAALQILASTICQTATVVPSVGLQISRSPRFGAVQ